MSSDLKRIIYFDTINILPLKKNNVNKNTPFILDNLSHSSICKLGLKNPNQGYAVRILKGIIYLPFAKARRVLGFNTLNEIAEEYIRNVA